MQISESKTKKGKAPLNASKVLTKSLLKQIAKEKAEYEEAHTHKEFKVAVKKFNIKPKHGVEYLLESKVFQGSPEDIAKFLQSAEGLDKRMIGDYLGEKDDFCIRVLHAFVDRMDFSKFEFDHALRYFLSKFWLPGEAQKIDRIMEAFATKYTRDNPKVFADQDAAYLLAFSMIMLNTDSHNPNIKKDRKMTLDDWVRTHRGLNGGGDFPESYLQKIYSRIVKEEIKMETEGVDLYRNAEKKGYLVKQGGRIKTWKKRYFVVSDNCLYYFKTHEEAEPIGIVPLENLAVRRTPSKKRYSFEIYHPEQNMEMKSAKFDSKGSVVKGHHDSYVIGASSEEELDEWVRAIESNIFKNPFVELVRKKLATQKVSKTPRSRTPTTSDTMRRRSENLAAKINFKQLLELATMCSFLPKDSKDDMSIVEKYGVSSTFGTVGKKFLYYSCINNDTKTQYVVIGSHNWGFKNLRKDFLFWKQDKKRDVFSFYKLNDAAKHVFEHLAPRLKKEHYTIITGYSLFSSIAGELAMLFSNDGFRLKNVITFGQPRVDTRESAENYSKLPMMRVIDLRDPVSALFPGYINAGLEVILLADKYHTNTEAEEVLEFDEAYFNESIDCHTIEYYISRIQPKLNNSILISYEEKEKYK